MRLPSVALAIGFAIAFAPGSARAAQAGCGLPLADSVVFVPVPGNPFQALPSADGCWLFVALNSDSAPQTGIAVLHRGNGAATVTRMVPLASGPAGMALTHDGALLLVSADDHVYFLDVARLTSGAGDPIVGQMSDGPTAGSVYVNVTTDDHFVFVSDERASAITVIDLPKARASKFAPGAVVGRIPVGRAPIALSFSPDERYLYTTSEVAPNDWGWPAACKPEGRMGAMANGPVFPPGALIVVDVARAQTDPAHAVLARVPAGCSPVRLALSARGDRAYVTARNSNAVLAFDTAKLLADSAHAQVASIPVGPAPVGIACADIGRPVLIVANSNRFAGGANDAQKLTVLDAAGNGASAVLGTILAGGFPRELRLTDGGRTLVVTNFNSMSVELVDLGRAK
jgi:DNA-binding beta-propeller fold protein YncE